MRYLEGLHNRLRASDLAWVVEASLGEIPRSACNVIPHELREFAKWMPFEEARWSAF
jgi:hypothetical protein